MTKYRKKPIEVEAFKLSKAFDYSSNVFDASYESGLVPIWFVEAVYKKMVILNYDHTVTIKTLEGDLLGRLDDYIIKGVKGELYPCKPDIFEATYDLSE